MGIGQLRYLVEKARASQDAYNRMASGEKVLVALLLNRLDLLHMPVALALGRCDGTSIRSMLTVAEELADEEFL